MRVPRPFDEKRAVFSINDAGKNDRYVQKEEVGLLPYIIWKITQNEFKNLTIITKKIIKLMEEIIGENSYNIGFGSDFLDLTPKNRK